MKKLLVPLLISLLLIFALTGCEGLIPCSRPLLTLFDALGKELLIFSKMAPMAGLATVEEIDILIAESHPVQVFVVTKGYLPNPCTKLGPIIQQREGNSFYVTIKTYSSQEICILLLAPFTETISLDVYGLPAGKYTVDVNGITGSFVLDIDNIPLTDI